MLLAGTMSPEGINSRPALARSPLTQQTRVHPHERARRLWSPIHLAADYLYASSSLSVQMLHRANLTSSTHDIHTSEVN